MLKNAQIKPDAKGDLTKNRFSVIMLIDNNGEIEKVPLRVINLSSGVLDMGYTTSNRGAFTLPSRGDKIQPVTLDIDVVMDENMNAYAHLYNLISNSLFKNEFNVMIEVTFYSSHNNPIRTMVYHNATITQLGQLDLSTSIQDSEPVIINASFICSHEEFK